MLDIRFVRENPALVKKDLEKRGDKEKQGWIGDLLGKDREYRKLLRDSEQLRARRNQISKEIMEAKKAGKSTDKLLKEAKSIPAKIKDNETNLISLKEKIGYCLLRLPNILHESVPKGKDDSENKVLREAGKKPNFSFKPQSHVDLLEKLGIGDIPRAAKVAGARFYYLKGELVLLDQAVLRFALDKLNEKGYTPILPPFMMRRKPYEGVTDLGDFEDVMYKIEGEDLYLIATSEHPLAAMHMDELFEQNELPIKYAGISPCFRKEAGAHGKDTKGIFRVHQFNKVEQFIFCRPDESWKLHDELIANAEEVFKSLEIPYRVVSICTGDIGTVAAKKYDIEAWMPAQNTYREMASCSNCTAYQAARLNIRYRTNKGNRHIHTLNSTAVATPRALVAILENFQEEDGGIKIPKALHPYLPFKEIRPKPKNK